LLQGQPATHSQRGAAGTGVSQHPASPSPPSPPTAAAAAAHLSRLQSSIAEGRYSQWYGMVWYGK